MLKIKLYLYSGKISKCFVIRSKEHLLYFPCCLYRSCASYHLVLVSYNSLFISIKCFFVVFSSNLRIDAGKFCIITLHLRLKLRIASVSSLDNVGFFNKSVRASGNLQAWLVQHTCFSGDIKRFVPGEIHKSHCRYKNSSLNNCF